MWWVTPELLPRFNELSCFGFTHCLVASTGIEPVTSRTTKAGALYPMSYEAIWMGFSPN